MTSNITKDMGLATLSINGVAWSAVRDRFASVLGSLALHIHAHEREHYFRWSMVNREGYNISSPAGKASA